MIHFNDFNNFFANVNRKTIKEQPFSINKNYYISYVPNKDIVGDSISLCHYCALFEKCAESWPLEEPCDTHTLFCFKQINEIEMLILKGDGK